VAKKIAGIEAVELFQRIVAGPELHGVTCAQKTWTMR
jgi:hypothetical protein